MTINYLDNSCFKIKGSKGTILIDPNTSKQPTDIVALSNSKNSFVEKIEGEFYTIDTAGEFEVKGIHVYGFEEKGATLFLVDIDGFKIVHMGTVKKALSDDLVGELSEADILLISVGGGTFMDSESATEVISQIEPMIVVPMNYETPDDFLKAMGKAKNGEMDKISLKSRSDLPQETEVIVLKP